MPNKADIRAEAARILSGFENAGAAPVDTDLLLPASTLLDLYGEDIRARAYTVSDPVRGELMLRPDFTVPVVQMHMANGADPARYAYAGEVFRRQEDLSGRANEYIQVGYEVFDRTDPAAADAEVFALISAQLAPMGLHPTTGDIGILIAAVQGLRCSENRRNALMRHLWRPRRFRALLERFGGRTPMPARRADLLSQADPFDQSGPDNGLRSRAEVAARLDALRADAAEDPIGAGEVDLIEDILTLRETCDNALSQLRDFAVDMPAIAQAVDGLGRRLNAMANRGIDISSLDFEATFGRSNMEYYDGFVFGFHAPGRPDLPPIATGGRYDALTRVLGEGREIPAVGAVIRPGLILELQEARS
ncbi:ATP phosphoribosyltransferase regulatory subunit [Aliiroseovarius sp. PTFE2010]|uniref:ATP phosphoribosyltransferase regulatory subunit n=1 Tax=Aliiroseovarius sp. PTFE2010 TaxID=3417190 RepID=UPI003CF5D48C